MDGWMDGWNFNFPKLNMQFFCILTWISESSSIRFLNKQKLQSDLLITKKTVVQMSVCVKL